MLTLGWPRGLKRDGRFAALDIGGRRGRAGAAKSARRPMAADFMMPIQAIVLREPRPHDGEAGSLGIIQGHAVPIVVAGKRRAFCP